jgi:hypothetical protein
MAVNVLRKYCPLLLIYVCAACLRLWGIYFSPTTPHARPDEDTFITTAFAAIVQPQGEAILATGWPEGFFRIEYALLRIEERVINWAWGQAVNLGCLYALNPGAVELPGRLFSVACDLLTIWLVGNMVSVLVVPEERARARATGMLVYGCNYLAVRDSHFGVSDSAITLCVAASLYFAIRTAKGGPAFLLAAIAIAFVGFGVKYSAVVMVPSCLVAISIALVRFKSRRRTAIIVVMALTGGVVLLAVISPAIVNHPAAMVAGLSTHLDRYNLSSLGKAMDNTSLPSNSLSFYVLHVLPASFGGCGAVLAAFGLALAVASDFSAGAILVASVFGALAILAGVTLTFVRYAALSLPALAVSLSYLLVLATTAMMSRLSKPTAIVGSTLLTVLAVAPPLRTAIQFDHLMAQPDTRDLASGWLLDKGATVRVLSEGWEAQVYLLDFSSELACMNLIPPWLNPGVPVMPSEDDVPSTWELLAAINDSGWVFITADARSRYIANHEGLLLADYVAVSRIRLPCGRSGGPLETPISMDNGCFISSMSFSPGEPACSSTVDVFDYFAAPFTGFEGWERPGPQIEIFENVCKEEYR